MQTAQSIAAYFSEQATNSGILLSPSAVQHLVYFAHGWSLALHNKSLVQDAFIARNAGVQIPSLVSWLKQLGNHAALSTNTTEGLDYASEETLSLLAKVWAAYGSYSEDTLTAMVTQPGTPWSQAKRKNPKMDSLISTESIKFNFLAQMTQHRQ